MTSSSTSIDVEASEIFVTYWPCDLLIFVMFVITFVLLVLSSGGFAVTKISKYSGQKIGLYGWTEISKERVRQFT